MIDKEKREGKIRKSIHAHVQARYPVDMMWFTGKMKIFFTAASFVAFLVFLVVFTHIVSIISFPHLSTNALSGGTPRTGEIHSASAMFQIALLSWDLDVMDSTAEILSSARPPDRLSTTTTITAHLKQLSPDVIRVRQLGFERRPDRFVSFVHPNDTHNDIMKDGEIVCELYLWKLGDCDIDKGTESIYECIERIGVRNLESVLPVRCRESALFRSFLLGEKPNS